MSCKIAGRSVAERKRLGERIEMGYRERRAGNWQLTATRSKSNRGEVGMARRRSSGSRANRSGYLVAPAGAAGTTDVFLRLAPVSSARFGGIPERTHPRRCRFSGIRPKECALDL